jgi:WD40 repeat protein
MRRFVCLGLIVGLASYTILAAISPAGASEGELLLFNKATVDWPNALTFSPLDKVLTVAVKGEIQTYLLPSCYELGKITGHSQYIQSLAYSSEGDELFSIGWDGKLCQWMLDTKGIPLSPPQGQVSLETKRPRCLIISPDGRFVITNGKDESVNLYQTSNFEKVVELQDLKANATRLASHAGRNRFLGGDKRGTLAVWDATSFKLIKRWRGHKQEITGLVVDPSTGEILSADAKGNLRRWDGVTFKLRQESNFGESIRGLEISPDGRFMYLSLKSGRVEILTNDFNPLEETLSLPSRPISLALDTGGRYLAMGGDNNQLRIWDLLQVREIRVAYDIPASLNLEVDLDDSASLIPNRALDGGEQVDLVCQVNNSGEGTAYDVTLNINCDNGEIDVVNKIGLGDIIAGEGKSVRIPVDVALHIKDGKASFNLHASEKKQNDARTALRLTVHHLPMPKLAITTITLDDSGIGNTSGNGNGIPENNEVVEVEVFVMNSGRGATWDSELMLVSHTQGVEDRIDRVMLPPIPPGGTTSGRLRLAFPKTFAETAFSVGVQVTDGVTGITADMDQSWQTRRNVPVLAGVLRTLLPLQNGDSGTFELTLENRGNLDAEQITIRISNDADLIISPREVSISRLAAGSNDPGKFFEVNIPPEFDRDIVNVTAAIQQANFSGATVSEGFPITLRQPRLYILGIPQQQKVVRGQSFEVDLSVENQGELAAVGVKVVVAAPDLGLRQEISLGRIQANGIGALDRIRFRIPSGMNTGMIDVNVEVTQRHFAPLRERFEAEIISEDIAVTEIQSIGPAGGLATPVGVGTGSGTGEISRSQSGLGVQFTNFQTTVYSSSYSLEILAQAPQGIRSLEVFLNEEKKYDLRTESLDQAKLRQVGGRFLSTELSLTNLRPGQANRLRVVIVGEDRATQNYDKEIFFEKLDSGLIAGLDPNIDVNRPRRSDRRNPDAVALLIGISKYRNRGCSIDDVEFAGQDVAAMKQTLINTLGYKEENILVLLDEDATKSDISLALDLDLRDMVERGKGKSDLLIYFCGHGAPGQDKETGYMIPFDGNPHERRIKQTAYALNDFYAAVREIPARKVTIIIDACFSGQFDGGKLIPDISPVGVSVESAIAGQDNWMVFSASGPSEISSWYREKKHGLFTYFFLKGLQGAVGKGEVSAGELHRYLRENVERIAKKRDIYQTPQFNGDHDQILVKED